MKKFLKIVGLLLLTPIIALNIYIIFTGKWFVYKAIRYNFVNIDDYKLFENKIVPKSTTPTPWPISASYNKVALTDTLEKTHQNLHSIAFVVIENDSIKLEKYWSGYNQTSISNSFSMAKSVVSILIGIAIKDGYIKSVDQLVSDFLPEFKEGKKAKITIKHLLMMSSGLDWDESKSYDNPISVFFSDIMEGYYGTDNYTLATSTQVAEPPGVFFDYKSGDTQLLSFIILKATGKSVSAYFHDKLWEPLCAEQDALWCVDGKGSEKAFCCINSNARDFARLGKLYLQQGWYNGKQIVDTSYVLESSQPNLLKDKDNPTETVDFYGYQIWSIPTDKNNKIVYFRGTLGQLIIVQPEKKRIIVRLGEDQGPRAGHHYAQTLLYLDEVEKMFSN